MKNSKITFVLIEVILGILVLLIALGMILEKNGNTQDKISVILQNPDDQRWSAFKYGLRMAAADYGIEMLVVSTDMIQDADEEENVVKYEIACGANGIIIQPAFKSQTIKTLEKLDKNNPVMLIGTGIAEGENKIPVVQPDYYAMGKNLAEEVLNDYNGKITGKTMGILMENREQESAQSCEKGFMDVIRTTGAEVKWIQSELGEDGESRVSSQLPVDFVIALDELSMITAGRCASENNLQGALLYGIGNSTESVYYLDTGVAECLIVPDDFSMGYRSLATIAEKLKSRNRKMESQTVGHTVFRKENLFSKENQEILYTMGQ